jgi:glycosyltransferase involved in cell wall biosynthesis
VSTPLRVSLVGLVAAGTSGVPRYAVALARAVDGVADEFPELRLQLLVNRAGAEAVAARRLAVRAVGGRGFGRGPARIGLEQFAAASSRADLLHFFDTTGPLLAPRRPFVTTAHDATVAHGFNPRKGGYKRRLHPWALEHAQATVAVSAFARDEVVRHYGADPGRVHVIHSGPGLSSPPTERPSAGRDGADPFFLYVGNLASNKNLPFLVRAFAAADPPARLVLAGRPGEGFEELQSAIAGSTAAGRIELRREVSDEDVERLYATATALVLPSLYEGFGFTPLEAMARDVPVLASDIPAVREVSGSGALLAPLEEAAWRDAIARIAGDEALRDDLRRRGKETVARYSWAHTARAVLSLFASLGEGLQRRGRG